MYICGHAEKFLQQKEVASGERLGPAFESAVLGTCLLQMTFPHWILTKLTNAEHSHHGQRSSLTSRETQCVGTSGE